MRVKIKESWYQGELREKRNKIEDLSCKVTASLLKSPKMLRDYQISNQKQPKTSLSFNEKIQKSNISQKNKWHWVPRLTVKKIN